MILMSSLLTPHYCRNLVETVLYVSSVMFLYFMLFVLLYFCILYNNTIAFFYFLFLSLVFNSLSATAELLLYNFCVMRIICVLLCFFAFCTNRRHTMTRRWWYSFFINDQRSRKISNIVTSFQGSLDLGWWMSQRLLCILFCLDRCLFCENSACLRCFSD